MPWVKVRSEVVAAHFEEKQPSLPQGLNTSKRASQEERPATWPRGHRTDRGLRNPNEWNGPLHNVAVFRRLQKLELHQKGFRAH